MKIERDNEMLLYTLNSISRSFSELNLILPLKGQKKERREKNVRSNSMVVENCVDGKGEAYGDADMIRISTGLEGMGSLMKELQVSARVSLEAEEEL